MLEYIVRPFTSPAGFASTLIPSTPAGTQDRAILTWGTKGTLPNPVGLGVNLVCCSEDQNELDRNFETVTIQDPNNSDNKVIVQRAKKLSLSKLQKQQDGCQNNLGTTTSFASGGQFAVTGFSTTDINDPDQNKCKITLGLNNNTRSPQGV